jgi:hypothetical protein
MPPFVTAVLNIAARAWARELSWRSTSAFGLFLDAFVPVGVFIFTFIFIHKGWFGMAGLNVLKDLAKTAVITVVVLLIVAIAVFLAAIPVTIYDDHKALLARIRTLHTEN